MCVCVWVWGKSFHCTVCKPVGRRPGGEICPLSVGRGVGRRATAGTAHKRHCSTSRTRANVSRVIRLPLAFTADNTRTSVMYTLIHPSVRSSVTRRKKKKTSEPCRRDVDNQTSRVSIIIFIFLFWRAFFPAFFHPAVRPGARSGNDADRVRTVKRARPTGLQSKSKTVSCWMSDATAACRGNTPPTRVPVVVINNDNDDDAAAANTSFDN